MPWERILGQCSFDSANPYPVCSRMVTIALILSRCNSFHDTMCLNLFCGGLPPSRVAFWRHGAGVEPPGRFVVLGRSAAEMPA